MLHALLLIGFLLSTLIWLTGTIIILKDLKHSEARGQTITTAVERIYAITWPIWILAMVAIGIVSLFFVLVDLLIKRIFFNESVDRSGPESMAR